VNTFAKITDGKITAYPYTLDDLRKDNPQTSFPAEMPPERMAEYGVFPVEEVPAPVVRASQSATPGEPVFANGAWRQTWVVTDNPPPSVPDTVSARQARLALLQGGILASVEAMIARQDKATRITWEYATEFRRDDPLLTQLAQNLGLSEAEIDQFFTLASTL